MGQSFSKILLTEKTMKPKNSDNIVTEQFFVALC